MGTENLTLIEWDFINGNTRPLFTESLAGRACYSDIAEATGELTIVQDQYKIVVLQTKDSPNPQIVYTVPESEQIVSRFVSFSPNGQKILFVRRHRNGTESLAPDQPHTVGEFDRASGQVNDLFTVVMPIDHCHYSPHDPSWVGFSHNEELQKLDRIWGWNKSLRNPPAALWNQQSATGPLYVGHERWMFDRTGIVAVAYPRSPGSPRGLYYVDPIEKTEKLISESNCDMHCNIDRSGKWAVVDTLSAWAKPKSPKGPDAEPDGRGISDIVLINCATGKRYWLARSHRKDHPWHAHPHISPDGRFVIYNDFQRDGLNTPSRTVVVELNLSAIDAA
jgi:hypothetical protein